MKLPTFYLQILRHDSKVYQVENINSHNLFWANREQTATGHFLKHA
jgi:hypothetical protein